MKHLLAALLTLLLLAACGEERQTFLLEGTFKGFNQGELYIYGAEGNREMDTIAVVKGRFHYEIPLEDSTTFVLVFPNFTELPVFGTKGAEITIEADASHLREAKVTGNRENEEFTKFRKSNIDQAPPEFALSVANFIKDNPASPFATYLLRRYFVQTPRQVPPPLRRPALPPRRWPSARLHRHRCPRAPRQVLRPRRQVQCHQRVEQRELREPEHGAPAPVQAPALR